MKTSILIVSVAATILLLSPAPCSASSYMESIAGSLGVLTNKTKDVAHLSKDVSMGIAHEMTRFIPTPENILTMSKDALLGLPFEVLLSCVDRLCSVALAAGNSTKPYQQPKLEEMNYVLLSEHENISIPITESSKLWSHEKFDKTKKVVVMVTGWNSDIAKDSSAADALWQAYKSRGDVNFVLIDTARYIDTLFAWSAFNTQALGMGLGKGLAELVKLVPVENIHVMGHSLGAHIVGAAGREFQIATEKILPRITGFDPAKPCFKEGESLQGLGRGDAEFVDIIHSDAGGLGKAEAIGDADFYPNGIVSLMPGCMTIFCSHSRSWQYYAESVYKGQENNFIARKCGSLFSYETGACIRYEVPMGYACPLKTKGNYFLKTKGSSPYGKGKV